MLIVLESILMGAFATFYMDLAAGFLAKRNLIYPFLSPEAIGRWFKYMSKGRFFHPDINQTLQLANEKEWCFVFHYLIGIFLAGFYLLVHAYVPFIDSHTWMAIVFVVVTVGFPWFWLLPTTGLGVMASKSPKKAAILKTNLVNHTNFGLGLFIWMITLHRLYTGT